MGESTLESEQKKTARSIVTIGHPSPLALLLMALVVANPHDFSGGLAEPAIPICLPLLLATIFVVVIVYPAAVAPSLRVFYSGRQALGVALVTLAFILVGLPAALMLLLEPAAMLPCCHAAGRGPLTMLKRGARGPYGRAC